MQHAKSYAEQETKKHPVSKHSPVSAAQLDALKAERSVEKQLRDSAFNGDDDGAEYQQRFYPVRAVSPKMGSTAVAAVVEKNNSVPDVEPASRTLPNGMKTVDIPWQDEVEPAQPEMAAVSGAPLEPAHGLAHQIVFLAARAHKLLTSLMGVPDNWGTTITTTRAPHPKAALIQTANGNNFARMIENQNAAMTAERVMEESLQNVAISSPWQALETDDDADVDVLSGKDRSDRLQAETPAKPHFLSAAETKKRGEWHVHFSNTFIALEKQDNDIQKTLNKLGDSSNLNVVGDITNIQDGAMSTLNNQQAHADAVAKMPHAFILHGDTAPEAKLLHEPFQRMQEEDEAKEAEINGDAAVKSP